MDVLHRARKAMHKQQSTVWRADVLLMSDQRPSMSTALALSGAGQHGCIQWLLTTAIPVRVHVLCAHPQVRFIGFNHVTSTELLAWNAVFVGLQVWLLSGEMCNKCMGGWLGTLPACLLSCFAFIS
jgi:hypothetical protein